MGKGRRGTRREAEPVRAQSVDASRTTLTRARYDRVAPLYDRLELCLERERYARWRARLWAEVRGPRVLEVGVGTGKNLAYHPRGARVTAIDFSPRMLRYARQRAARAGDGVDFCRMDAQYLAFPNDTFDTVAATFVFGSVPDPALGLREVGRVMKPGGRVLLLEYVRSAGPLGLALDLLNPLALLIYGANVNRRTPQLVQRAGLRLERVENLWRDVVRLIVASRGDG